MIRVEPTMRYCSVAVSTVPSICVMVVRTVPSCLKLEIMDLNDCGGFGTILVTCQVVPARGLVSPSCTTCCCFGSFLSISLPMRYPRPAPTPAPISAPAPHEPCMFASPPTSAPAPAPESAPVCAFVSQPALNDSAEQSATTHITDITFFPFA